MTSTGHFLQAQLAVIDDAVTRIERREARRRALDAEHLEDLARALDAAVGPAVSGPEKVSTADRELAYRSLRLELATATRESERVVERHLSTAHAAVHSFQATLEALRAAEISLQHVRVVTDEGALLETGHPERDAPRRAAYEREVLEFARDETPGRLRPIARRLAASHAEASLAERHEEALKRRCVRVVPFDNGMADLIAHLSAEDAYAIRDRITQLAKRAEAAEAAAGHSAVRDGDGARTEQTPGEQEATGPAPRSRDEVRADVARDLLLGGGSFGATASGGAAGPAGPVADDQVLAHVQVVIPADGAPELIGYGPIDTRTAARIAATADAWERISVDDAGGIVSVDRYRPSPQMKRLLAARDLHCRAPGCRVPASRCDIDHTVDAAMGGPTSTDNLAHLCRGHHTLKHHSDWSVSQARDGEMRWTSPTGREHIDRPPSRVRFRRTREPESAAPATA